MQPCPDILGRMKEMCFGAVYNSQLGRKQQSIFESLCAYLLFNFEEVSSAALDLDGKVRICTYNAIFEAKKPLGEDLV
mgnify:CR=1 FL=1